MAIYNRRIITALKIGFLMSLLQGCAGSVTAPKTKNGLPVEVHLLVDVGLKDNMHPDKKHDQTILGEKLDEDMRTRLSEGGYKTIRINSIEEYSNPPSSYLIVAQIDSFRAMGLYSQKEMRLGDRVTEIKTTVKLFKNNRTLPIMIQTEMLVCTYKWTNCVAELNKILSRKISKTINEFH